jgi:cytochrome c5
MLKFGVGLMLFMVSGLIIATSAMSGKSASRQQAAMTPTPSPTPQMGRDWILLNNVPPGSSQIVYGREIYRLVCSACHGDKGQGLTTEWRMTWAPQDQNCWRSKCHGFNHPSDGFFLPYSPPVTNLARSRRFPTALDLQIYIQQSMPWQDPGSMLDERAWQVTAYVLTLNNIDAGSMLTAESAARIRLAPESADSPLKLASTPSSEATPPANVMSSPANVALPIVAALLIAIAVLAGGIFLRRKPNR